MSENKFKKKKKTLINDTAIPQHVIENIARCLLPDILTDFEHEDIRCEFAEWQKAQDADAQKPASE